MHATLHRRELSVAIAILALSIALAIAAPGFFTLQNQSDLLLANMPVLIVALGMTLVILAGRSIFRSARSSRFAAWLRACWRKWDCRHCRREWRPALIGRRSARSTARWWRICGSRRSW
jgi:predicted lipoprotein with Yx(FWY)xxD motif